MLEKIESSSGCLILRLLEDLIMENVREFYEDFLEAIQNSSSEIVLDFSKTRFIDSSGIGILLKCIGNLKEQKSTLLINGLNRQMHSVFKLAGLLKIFEILEDEDVKKRFPELINN